MNAYEPLQHALPSERDELIALIPQMRAFARCLCGDASLADDVAKDALARALSAPEGRVPAKGLKIQLFAFIRDELHLRRRHHAQMSRMALNVHDGMRLSAERTLAAMGADEIRRALLRLPSDQREAVVLIEAGRVPSREAAAVCGCANLTIGRRVSLAHKNLVAILTSRRPARARPPQFVKPAAQRRGAASALSSASV